MRVAFIGVSHWHAPLYYRPAARLAGIEIVGVNDADQAVAQHAGREAVGTVETGSTYPGLFTGRQTLSS